jgi:hypothetical protein
MTKKIEKDDRWDKKTEVLSLLINGGGGQIVMGKPKHKKERKVS